MRMDVSENFRDLNKAPLLRWILLTALLLLGVCYVFAFALFVTRSKDFLVVRRNDAAEAFALQHPITPSAEIEFRSGAPMNSILGGGWHHVEPHGVWSSATDSWLSLKLPRGISSAVLRLNTNVLVAKHTSRTAVTVTVNDRTSHTWDRDLGNASEPLEMRLSDDVLQTGYLSIRLHIPHITSPFAEHAGPDHRPLGILLSSVVVADELEQSTP